MAYTLRDFKNRVRLRLGELTDGTWETQAEYEGNQEIDELKMLVNDAQISVCRDLFTQQWMPFRRLQEVLPIFSQQTIYTLPADYIQMVNVYHHKENQIPLLLEPRILSKYRQRDPNYADTSASSGSYFRYYEVSGQIGEVLAEGTVTWIDDAFQFAADNADLQNVRVGDIVNNLTDKSQGVITEFGSGIATLGDRLHGGRSNRIQYGDEFMIQSREENRFVLETWPPITLTEQKLETTQTRVSNARIGFTPDIDSTIESIEIQLPQDLFLEDGALHGINPQTRLLLYIREIDTTTDEIGQTVDIIGFQNVKVGINTLNVVESEISKGQGSLQLNRHIAYDAYLTTQDPALGLLIENSLIPVLGEIDFLQPVTDYLSINYTKRPAEMIIDDSVCELYQEFSELIVEKAVLIALRKKDPNMINASIQAHYKLISNRWQRVSDEPTTA